MLEAQAEDVGQSLALVRSAATSPFGDVVHVAKQVEAEVQTQADDAHH